MGMNQELLRMIGKEATALMSRPKETDHTLVTVRSDKGGGCALTPQVSVAEMQTSAHR